MPKFKVGEMAIFAISRCSHKEHYINHPALHVGNVVEIMGIGPFKKGDKNPFSFRRDAHFNGNGDYCIRYPDNQQGAVMEWQLLKMNDPDAVTEESNEECLNATL